MGWLIALGVFLVIFSIPLGATLQYDSDGIIVKIIAAFFRFQIYPLNRKGKSAAQSTKPAPAPAKQAASKGAAKPAPKAGGSLKDFFPFIRIGMQFLNSFRQKLRVNLLQLRIILAGDDPCDLAVNYGRAWAAVGTLMPQLERVFVIGKRDIEVECDFIETETKVIFHMDITITIGRLLMLAVIYGCYTIREFFRFKKKRKGGVSI